MAVLQLLWTTTPISPSSHTIVQDDESGIPKHLKIATLRKTDVKCEWLDTARHPCHAQAISKAHVPMVPLTTEDVTWGAACIRTQRLCPLHHVGQGIMLLCFFFFLMRALSYIVRAALHAG